MISTNVIKALKSQGTWRLLFLSFITFGIYTAHYIRRQTIIINAHIEPDDAISEFLVNAFMALSYLSVAMMIPYILVADGHPVETISDLLDFGWTIMTVVWAFMARRRMNQILGVSRKGMAWFHGFWTFLFTYLYFNYQVNKINGMAIRMEGLERRNEDLRNLRSASKEDRPES